MSAPNSRLDKLPDDLLIEALEVMRPVMRTEAANVASKIEGDADYCLFIAGSEAKYLMLLATVGFDVILNTIKDRQKGTPHAAP